jgi:ubiquinone/menaquinone biosynthesis C-methylase UbiE
MTATSVNTTPGLASRLINGILAIKPLADLAKSQARNMMIKRAEKIGVPWRDNVKKLLVHDWESERATVENPQVVYPEYYVCSFHAYKKGNLDWEPALEVESAAYAVHGKIWSEGGNVNGDPMLRQSYHDVIKAQIPVPPRAILDLGCSVGMSTFALQEVYPQAKVTGLDLSPYYLAVAQYRARERHADLKWVHAPAEATDLPDASFDLVSSCLMFHELPQKPSKEIFREARRLLRPGGYLAIMDMNPQSEVFKKMPPYILTLLKSTEPYLDQYFTLDVSEALVDAGFQTPTITPNSPRHRTIIAQVK